MALIPSVEIARGREPYAVVPGVGIVSYGPVRSVLLVLKGEPEEIRSLALDTSSRTSVALSQIVLQRHFDCRPRVFPCVPNLPEMLEGADAALLIGDPALELDVKRYRVLDLGEMWTEMTGLPFVYACWTGRMGALGPEDTQRLIDAKGLGCRHIGEISEHFAESRPLPPAFYTEYLTRYIRYDLGEAELEGLRRFYAYALELGLIDRAPEIAFFPRP